MRCEFSQRIEKVIFRYEEFLKLLKNHTLHNRNAKYI